MGVHTLQAVSPEQTALIQSICTNFTPQEFQCHCCGACKMDKKLLQRLQAFRHFCDFPLTLNSAYRCDAHNRAVGGKESSRHLRGQAVDISLTNIPSPKRWRMIEGAVSLFYGIGFAKSFIHVDIRDTKIFWTYGGLE